ncbi:MAG: hypothetical protein HY302_07455 [Opitutae bacterium]|nr:hypothetical protein [Opitutae bacterium]
MKRPLLACLALATTAFAGDVAYAPPLGGLTISVPTGQTRAVSLPLVHAAVGAGAVVDRVGGVGANFIDVPAANWAPGAFSTPANPYYLRLRSGAAAGRLLLVNSTANTASRVFVNNDGTDLTQVGVATGPAGDTYELVLADTLRSLFGSTTLQGGPTAVSADNVQVWGGASWLVFYFNTTRQRWELNTDTATTPARDNFVLRPDRGIMIARRGATDLTLRLTGRVPEVAPRHVHTRPGNSFLSDGLPVDLTLSGLGLRTRTTGWQENTAFGTAAATADLIQVWGGASWLIFYYNSTSGHWQLTSDTATSASRDGFTIPAGRPVMIRRMTVGASASENVINLPMPYLIRR